MGCTLINFYGSDDVVPEDNLLEKEAVRSELETEKVDTPTSASETDSSLLDEILSSQAGESLPALDGTGSGNALQQKEVIVLTQQVAAVFLWTSWSRWAVDIHITCSSYLCFYLVC